MIPLSHLSTHFRLFTTLREDCVKIKMKMITPVISTAFFPNVVPLLEERIPGIFHNKCFNYENLSFRKEVVNTELGHLFEHMVLEFLCEEKRIMGDKEAIYNGRTSWNWNKEKRGTFNIRIDAGIEDKELVNVAILRSIHLMNDIIKDGLINPAGSHVHDRPLKTEPLY